jgi:hypothetical protein
MPPSRQRRRSRAEDVVESRELRVERSSSTLDPELSTTSRLSRHFVGCRAAALEKFIARYRSLVTGVLSGFDRLVFRGSLLPVFRDGGMFFFPERAGVRLLDFEDFVTRTSDRVKEAAYAEAAKLGRPVQYLESSESDKEKIAKRMLADQPVAPEEVLAPLQVLRPSPVRFHERAAADVVPLQRADLPQRARVGRAAAPAPPVGSRCVRWSRESRVQS